MLLATKYNPDKTSKKMQLKTFTLHLKENANQKNGAVQLFGTAQIFRNPKQLQLKTFESQNFCHFKFLQLEALELQKFWIANLLRCKSFELQNTSRMKCQGENKKHE